MKRLFLILCLAATAGCVHTSTQHAATRDATNPETLRNEIDALQDEVDVLARTLHRERSIVLKAEAPETARDKNIYDLIAIKDSLQRQRKALEAELQAMSHVIQSPF